MFEWIDTIETYFTQLGESINTLVFDVQTLVDNLNAYITLSTYYIYGSGFILLILIICVFALMHNVGKLRLENCQQDKDLEYIIELLEKQIKNQNTGGIRNGTNDERNTESNFSGS